MIKHEQRKVRRGPLLFAMLIAMSGVLALASSASALTLGVGWSGEPAWSESEMPLVAKSGAQAFRQPLPPTNNNDSLVRKAAESSVTFHAEVSTSYPGDPGLPSGANRTDFLNKLSSEVKRYGYNGEFWSEPQNASLPKEYITTWEVWNEPNMNEIGPVEFGQFVNEAANTIQAASQAQAGHTTNVLSGGILAFGNLGGTSGNWKERGETTYTAAARFIEEAYPYFGSNSNVTGVAVHPYEVNDATFLKGAKTTRIEAFKFAVAGFHALLVELAKGGAQKSLWITETGWPAEGPQFPIGEVEQANALRQVVDYLRNNEASLNVKDLLWYNFRDRPGTVKWDQFCGLRAHDGHFRQAWTAFQEKAGVPQTIPQAPGVETQAPTNLGDAQVTLNGTVNPHGLPTSYRFEYGTTPSYGTSIPVPDGNAGASEGATSRNAELQGLQPSTTYYYRIVATNAVGTSYGTGSSFKTNLRSKPAVLSQSNGDREIFFRASNGQLKWWYWNNAKGWSLQWLGSTNAMAGDPAALEQSNGDRQIFYRDNNGRLSWWYWNNAKGTWTQEWLGSANELAGDPTPVNDSSGGEEIYYRSTSGQLKWWWWSTAKGWSLQWLGSTNAMAGDPSVLDQTNGDRQIFYRDNNGRLSWWYWNNTKGTWTQEWLGSANELAGDPVPVNDSSGGEEIYYRATNGRLNWWWWSTAKGWSLQWLGSTNAVAGDPAVLDQTNGDRQIFYRSTSGTLQWWYWNNTKGTWTLEWLGSANELAGDPTPVNDSSGGEEIYYGSQGGLLSWWWWSTAKGWSLQWLSGAEL